MNTKLEQIAEWSDGFKALKRYKAPTAKTVAEIISYYRLPVGGGKLAQRESWLHVEGYRKTHKRGTPAGEQKIERLLLQATTDQAIRIIGRDNAQLTLQVTDQNVPLLPVPKGQVVCDAFGYVTHRGKVRPVVIEVKVDNQDPWFAVVENLIQVRLARFNLANIERWAVRTRLKHSAVHRARGTWGVVVAPERYFRSHQRTLEAALSLIQAVTSETEARIMLCASDELDRGELRWLPGSYWPR